jgi:hypothetical protein
MRAETELLKTTRAIVALVIITAAFSLGPGSFKIGFPETAE